MSFKASSDIPLITWGDLHALNQLVRPSPLGEKGDRLKARPLDDLKNHHHRWMERRLMSELKGSHYVVLSAIVARTFAWNKAIEVIPLSVFTQGMREHKHPDRFATDDEGMPYFSGTGLSTSTVRRALADLADHHLIERFQVPGAERNTYAYMPVSAFVLHAALAMTASAYVGDIPKNVRPDLKTHYAVGRLEEMFLARWIPNDETVEPRNAA